MPAPPLVDESQALALAVAVREGGDGGSPQLGTRVVDEQRREEEQENGE